jgi:hypothetical protein
MLSNLGEIVKFGHFLKVARLELLFSQKKLRIKFCKLWMGLHFLRFFHIKHPITLAASKENFHIQMST